MGTHSGLLADVSFTEGTLELHTHYLIPSLRQVVFQGDRLPFQCSASYLGNDTHIHWYHNGAPMESDEQAGIVLAENLIHDCTFITRYRLGCPFLVEDMGKGSHSSHSFPDMLRGEGKREGEGDYSELRYNHKWFE